MISEVGEIDIEHEAENFSIMNGKIKERYKNYVCLMFCHSEVPFS